MFPYKTSIQFDRKSKQPLYLQLSNQIIAFIKNRKLISKTKLPGSRKLATMLGVHRKTIVACYEELILQGWAESIPKKGTFVYPDLPELHQQDYANSKIINQNANTGFLFYKNDTLNVKSSNTRQGWMSLNDGICDVRLTPTDELARIYRRVLGRKSNHNELSYRSAYGNEKIRTVLVNYLNNTRGLNISIENILITRGSQMGIYLSSQLLLKEGDVIVVGKTNYIAADMSFKYQKAVVKRVCVDQSGLDTNAIEKLCMHQKIKAVYLTSHHHHPTTVTLSAERRIHLLNLAKQYNFAILEDDYDYDFNYNHAPILPLASHDTNGNVVYIGSLCKTVAPVFRIGYLIASKEFLDTAASLRKIIDRQGDALLEITFAEFIKSGDLDRHIRKTLKIYKIRRDLFCSLLQKELSSFFQFDVPKGGMAVWLKLHKKISWKLVAKTAKNYQLEIGDWERYDIAKTGHNAVRIGFACYNEQEIHMLVFKLKQTLIEIEKGL